jgi:serine/threonine-protein kinase
VAYYAVSGALPFTAATSQAVLAKQVTQTPAPVATVARGIPRALAQAIDACLHKEPSRRLQSGEALADALQPGLETRAEIPVPIRAFLDRRRFGVALALPAMLLPSMVISIEHLLRFGLRPMWLAILVLQSAAVIAIPAALIIGRLRPLLKLGYGHEDIGAGLQLKYDRKREEFFYEHGGDVSKRERAFGALGILGFGVSVISSAALIAGTSNPAFLFGMVGGAYVGILASVLSNRWLRLRRGVGSFWADRWRGRMGRVLSKIASISLGPRALVAERPTEIAIALSADALFNELPKHVRKSLGDIPAAVRALEQQARVIRTRIAQLDAIIVETQSKTSRADVDDKRESLLGDLRSARAEADKRLADLVTARLDLLRLRAGQGSAEGITQGLESAKALGEDVDRLIAGSEEVDSVLRREHTDTPV